MLRNLRWFALLLLAGGVSALAETEPGAADAAAVTTITVPKYFNPDYIDAADYYFSRVLELALDKTRSSDGAYVLTEAEIRFTDNRLKAELNRGHVDVIWSPTSRESERTLLPVKVDLFDEIGSYRIFIIRAGDQPRFDKVRSLDDLRQFTAGMSNQWVDAAVMRANNLPFTSALRYDRLMKMLSARRFDYFSRGLYQVKHEIDMHTEGNLVMEKRLMLHYPSNYYFFVNKNNVALADRLDRGLKMAKADGSFDELFYSIPRHQWARKELDKRQRLILTLELPE